MKAVLIIGCDDEKELIKSLKNKPTIIIGIPGSIYSLIKRNLLNLSNIQIFIIDKCDKMLNALDKF